jgi:ribonuclease Z
MVDTGWYGAVRMLSYDLDPTRLEYLFITHRHNDHTLGLPQLLLYRRIKRIQDGLELPPLKIVGPKVDLPGIIQRAVAILQWPDGAVLPEGIPLDPGEGLETGGFILRTCAADHTAPGLVYRFIDKRNGRQLAFTGDTMYSESIVSHVRGVSLLIHEACYNDGDPPDKPGKHCQPRQAAEAARKAEVGRLALIHATPHFRERKVEAAREIFPNTFWPRDGETVSA